ncbi:DUF6378 domain-containing protein [Mycobacterium paragordonae]|uniref:DUF6378 domain-containing protein n=1 Tax=Mycobacterium paragordonae TaxID=1389713 RepID=A0AAJ1RY25_9MYCO|nr:DUF6378 domain-containing protein [Mycobacterium paragordonae]MDP7733678.1 DUF6378 domain-containing protein [Mycobacterium paragordonae]
MPESILQEAERLINGERQESYGNATESHERIADLWTAYLGDVTPLTAFDVVNMMVLLKVSRSKGGLNSHQFQRDSYVDIAGYAALGERIHQEISAGIEDGPRYIVGWDFHIGQREPVVEVEPRQWDSLYVTPWDVEVRDDDGDIWKHDEVRGWGFKSSPSGRLFFVEEHGETSKDYNYVGPFVEILEGE